MDLRGQDDYYVAIVATTNAICDNYDELAIHEFGHLLGAAHQVPQVPQGSGLYIDSNAYVRPGTGSFAGNDVRSLVSTLLPNAIQINEYSSDVGTTNNRRAIIKTAKSVANYRITRHHHVKCNHQLISNQCY